MGIELTQRPFPPFDPVLATQCRRAFPSSPPSPSFSNYPRGQQRPTEQPTKANFFFQKQRDAQGQGHMTTRPSGGGVIPLGPDYNWGEPWRRALTPITAHRMKMVKKKVVISFTYLCSVSRTAASTCDAVALGCKQNTPLPGIAAAKQGDEIWGFPKETSRRLFAKLGS